MIRISLPALACFASAAIVSALALGGCAPVPQKDREFLADPVMRPVQDETESALEAHGRPLREGASGGDGGAGGGCGC